MPAKTRTARTAAKAPAPVKSTKAKARIGKKAIVGYYSPKMSEQLHELAEKQDKTMQVVVGEALNMMFAKHKMPQFEIE